MSKTQVNSLIGKETNYLGRNNSVEKKDMVALRRFELPSVSLNLQCLATTLQGYNFN